MSRSVAPRSSRTAVPQDRSPGRRREHAAQRRRKFSPEFRDEAVKMVVVESRPITEVAREIQVNEGTLGTWVSRYRQEYA
ncbi:transposase [Streptomyces mirabilis]|uniref:transposase n=1 Tax=Streptomyces mirabilis TaxID=68239 RepID=UPI0036B857F7